MRSILAIYAVFGSFVWAASFILAGDGKDAPKKELAALKGTWTIVSGERDGKKFTEEQLKGVTMIYDGAGNATVRKDDQIVFEGTISVDPTKKPKSLDVTQTSKGATKGRTFFGIYEFDGNTLKICSAEPPGKERPTEFSSKPGSGHFLRIYKREKK